MKRSFGRVLVGTFVASATVMALAALAWACTAQTRVIALTPQAGPVGSQVVIKGEGVPPGSPVDIRWNALEGASLGSVNADAAGSFSATVTIPEASNKVNFLMAIGQSGVARVPFEVASPATAEVISADAGQAADLWSGLSPARGDLAELTSDPLGRTSPSIPVAATMATVVGLGLAAFSFGLAAGARRRRASAGL